MNNKELKLHWTNKTLGELKAYYLTQLDIYNKHQTGVKEIAFKIYNLDFNDKNYETRYKNLLGDLNSYKADIKHFNNLLTILKPILEKKESEGLDIAEYEEYIADNINVNELIKAVNKIKDEMILNNDTDLDEDEIIEMHDITLKETILLIKDNAGDIKKVDYIKFNNNKGFDCKIIGTKHNINIQTIIAGGYNVQKLHYRTLVQRI